MRTFYVFIVLFIGLLLLPVLTTPVLAVTRKSINTTSVATPTSQPAPTPTVMPVKSYELFWPIAPGKVMGDSLYSLKSFKEAVRESLIFGDVKKSEYNIILSEKRTIEAEYLFIIRKDYTNAVKTLSVAQQKREKARDLYIKAKVQKTTGDLQNKLILSLEKQKSLLTYLTTQVSEDQKKTIENNITGLKEVLMSIQ